MKCIRALFVTLSLISIFAYGASAEDEQEITLVGNFTVTPDRQIVLEPPDIDPNLMPIPIDGNGNDIPTTTGQNPSHKVDRRKLMIGLLVGLFIPFVLAIIAAIILRYMAKREFHRKGISMPNLRTDWKIILKPNGRLPPPPEMAMAQTPPSTSHASPDVSVSSTPLKSTSAQVSSPKLSKHKSPTSFHHVGGSTQILFANCECVTADQRCRGPRQFCKKRLLVDETGVDTNVVTTFWVNSVRQLAKTEDFLRFNRCENLPRTTVQHWQQLNPFWLKDPENTMRRDFDYPYFAWCGDRQCAMCPFFCVPCRLDRPCHTTGCCTLFASDQWLFGDEPENSQVFVLPKFGEAPWRRLYGHNEARYIPNSPSLAMTRRWNLGGDLDSWTTSQYTILLPPASRVAVLYAGRDNVSLE